MSDGQTLDASRHREHPRGTGLLALSAITAALGAVACCILPLAFISLGISSASMVFLHDFGLYQPYLIGFAILAIGYGFYQVYWRRLVYTEGAACALPLASRLVRVELWVGAIIVALAASFPIWILALIPNYP